MRPRPLTPTPPASRDPATTGHPTYHLPGCSGKRKSAHPQGRGWDGTGLHADNAETHRETRQSDSGDLGKQEDADQLPVGNTGRIPGQPPLSVLTCEARVTQAAEAPTWVLQAVPGMRRMAGTWATLIDVPLTAQASVSWEAGAAEPTHQVHAGTIVQAPRPQVQGRAWATVILINLAEHAWGVGDGEHQEGSETEPPRLSPSPGPGLPSVPGGQEQR